jgi:hypothetical protein
MIPEHRRAAGVGRLGGVPGFLTERVSYTLAAMSLYVLLLKPAEPTVFDDAPSKPFHCTVIAHYPVTGPYAHVLVASLSSEDKRANEESFKSPLPSHGFITLDGKRHELEVLRLHVDDEHAPRLGVSIADIGSG